MGVEIAVIKNKANLIWIIAAGAALTGCASVYQRVPDASNLDVRAGRIVLHPDWDHCRGQQMEATRSQFREAATLKCGEDQACRDETYEKLAEGRSTLGSVAKGAVDGSALGLIPLAAGSSTASWGNATLAGMAIGAVLGGAEPSIKSCTSMGGYLDGKDENGKDVGTPCWGWLRGKGLDWNGDYTDEERVTYLLASDFDRSHINDGDPVVMVYKTGPMIKRRCALMTTEEFKFVQERTGIRVDKGKLQER